MTWSAFTWLPNREEFASYKRARCQCAPQGGGVAQRQAKLHIHHDLRRVWSYPIHGHVAGGAIPPIRPASASIAPRFAPLTLP